MTGKFKTHTDKQLELDSDIFSSLNMMAQRATIKSIDNHIRERQESTKTLRSKRQSTKNSFNSVGLIPLYGNKKFKSFPELVNTLNNPFTKSGLNIALHNVATPGSRSFKNRSNYYKTCRGCSMNINRLVMTRSIERITNDTIIPASATQSVPQ